MGKKWKQFLEVDNNNFANNWFSQNINSMNDALSHWSQMLDGIIKTSKIEEKIQQLGFDDTTTQNTLQIFIKKVLEMIENWAFQINKKFGQQAADYFNKMALDNLKNKIAYYRDANKS